MLICNRGFVVALGTVLVGFMIGCSSSVPVATDSHAAVATFAGNHTATLQSQANMMGVRSEDQQAVFFIDETTVTVTASEVTSSRGQSIPLPARWSHVELAHTANIVSINVDGKTVAHWGVGT